MAMVTVPARRLRLCRACPGGFRPGRAARVGRASACRASLQQLNPKRADGRRPKRLPLVTFDATFL